VALKSGMTTHGTAAAKCDAKTLRAYNGLAAMSTPLYHFCVVLWVLGLALCEFLGMLGAEAAAAGDMSKPGFVVVALRKLTVGLGNGNSLATRASAREQIGTLRLAATSGALLCFVCARSMVGICS
jgi:hypothetical protein